MLATLAVHLEPPGKENFLKFSHEVVEKQRIRKLEQGHDMLTLISSKRFLCQGQWVKFFSGRCLKGELERVETGAFEGVTV